MFAPLSRSGSRISLRSNATTRATSRAHSRRTSLMKKGTRSSLIDTKSPKYAAADFCLNLTYILMQIKKEGTFADPEKAVKDYKAWLLEVARDPSTPHPCPYRDVDRVWKRHERHTELYRHDCEKLFGKGVMLQRRRLHK
mmetsp:Transcript_13829/g.27989  ORF Transcript_13829/g.27989 Transcript_13829/m.27989 type:complete len:140 (-) Transcript_13829:317-736(-)